MFKKIVLSVAVAGLVAAATPSAFAANSSASQIANGSVSQNEGVSLGIWPNTASK